MTLRKLTIVQKNSDEIEEPPEYAVVTTVVHHPYGEPQVFLRRIANGDQLQTTLQMLETDLWEVVGHWSDQRVRNTIQNSISDPNDPVELCRTDDTPIYYTDNGTPVTESTLSQ